MKFETSVKLIKQTRYRVLFGLEQPTLSTEKQNKTKQNKTIFVFCDGGKHLVFFFVFFFAKFLSIGT